MAYRILCFLLLPILLGASETRDEGEQKPFPLVYQIREYTSGESSFKPLVFDGREYIYGENSSVDMALVFFRNAAYRENMSLKNLDAEIHIAGTSASKSCSGATNLIVCDIKGPAKIALKFEKQMSFYEIEDDGFLLCYAGRKGVFCD